MRWLIRTFLAIEIPEDIKKALGGLIERMARVRVNGLRPVEMQGMHLTVKFLGEVTMDQVESVIRKVSEITIESRPFELKLGNVGAFPNSRNPRVLWIGIEGETESLRELQNRIETALEELGFPKEARPFHPHLTLARLGDRSTPIDRRRVTEALFSAEFESGHPIKIGNLSLMRSELRAEGAHYDRLAESPLSGE